MERRRGRRYYRRAHINTDPETLGIAGLTVEEIRTSVAIVEKMLRRIRIDRSVFESRKKLAKLYAQDATELREQLETPAWAKFRSEQHSRWRHETNWLARLLGNTESAFMANLDRRKSLRDENRNDWRTEPLRTVAKVAKGIQDYSDSLSWKTQSQCWNPQKEVSDGEYSTVYCMLFSAKCNRVINYETSPVVGKLRFNLREYDGLYRRWPEGSSECEMRLETCVSSLNAFIREMNARTMSEKEREKASEKKRRATAEKIRKEQRIKALAAAKVGKTRKESESIKRSLRIQIQTDPNCPYCANPLGESIHADHIYPVARGGLSTEENMVFVCRSCNLKKKDLTLREFVLMESLDRDAVESALQFLGKAF